MSQNGMISSAPNCYALSELLPHKNTQIPVCLSYRDFYYIYPPIQTFYVQIAKI